jgi:hypothetical protein
MRSLLIPAFLSTVLSSPTLEQRQQELPRAVNLAPEFQKLDLPAREQGDRADCSLFAITGAVNFELATTPRSLFGSGLSFGTAGSGNSRTVRREAYHPLHGDRKEPRLQGALIRTGHH